MNELPNPLLPGEHITNTWISNLLRAIRRQRPLPGPGVSTRVTPEGTVLSATDAPAHATPRSLAPFTVRLHKTDDDPDGQFEIYLPSGCCNVGGTCEPINPKAKDSVGHEEDGDDWYSIHFDQSLRFATTNDTTNTGQGVLEYTNSFIVSVHAKTSAKRYGVDLADASARNLLWIGVRDRNLSTSGSGAYTDSVHYKDTPGDTWSCDVAEIFGSMEIDWSQQGASAATAEKRWRVAQYRTSPIDVSTPQGVGVLDFDLVWNLAVTDGELEVKNLFCVRQSAAAAGITLTGDYITDVLDARSVYARVDATDMSNGYGVVQVLKDPEGTGQSTPYVVWLPLYDLVCNTVTVDHRPQSLVNLQILHA